ncbi:MAG: ABC transporter ATP-binding protein [Butyrivibrio sp.]|nr:ABC transporter ATP-binding protein [Butyrivibrio sp.]
MHQQEKEPYKPGKGERFPSRSSMVLYFLKGSTHYFLWVVFFSFCVSFLDMLNPKLIQYTVDYLLTAGQSTLPAYVGVIVAFLGGQEVLRAQIWRMAITVACIALLTGICRYLVRLLNSKGAEKLMRRMRDTLFDHIQHLPFSWHGENHTGDIIQRCTSDVETIKAFIADQLVMMFRIIILIAMGMYFMVGISPRMTIFSAVFIPIVLAYSMFFHNRIGDAFRHADEEEGALSAIAQENLTGVRVVRAFGREIYERERFETKNEDYTRMWIRLMRLLAGFWCSNDLISGLQIMLVTVVGAVFCVHGDITVGQYIAFVSYNGMLTWPVRGLGRVISEMSKAGISIDRICYIMNARVEGTAGETRKPPMDRDIAFDHVSYVYDNGSAEVLHDVSFRIKAGSTVGILGGTGSGKSTMMYLLDRLYELPEEHGSITIGDVDIREIDRYYLRSHIGLVLQEPFLFSRTLSENISITQSQTDMNKVRHAARIAALDETIDSFSAGYETFVGERGVTLSGGQKQRAAIAQMLVGMPTIMIFDDSLSAVDTETDERIRTALQENLTGSTVILISHRITTLMHADQIIVLDRGRIAEQGDHETLLQKNGIYRRIYDIQMAGADGNSGASTEAVS